jgi:hypothetical protein
LFFQEQKFIYSQNGSIKTFLVAYSKNKFKPGGHIENYSIFDNWPQTDDDRNAIYAVNPKVAFLRYVNMIDVDMGNDPVGKDIVANHSDFLLKTIGGQLNPGLPFEKKYAWGYLHPYDSSKSTKSRVFLNPASSEWAAYYSKLCMNELSKMKGPYTKGIFVDNAWPVYKIFFMNSPKDLQIDMNNDGKMDEADDWAWAQGMLQFSNIVRNTIGSSSLIIANYGGNIGRDNTAHLIQQKGYFDGFMQELFIHTSLKSDSASYPDFKHWAENVNTIIIADSLNRIVLAQSLGQETDYNARLFTLCSFLLGAGEKAYFNYRYVNSYNTVFRFPEFDLNLGKPLEIFSYADDSKDPKTGLYTRHFQKGEVAVNPLNNPLTLNINATQKLLILNGGTIEHGGRIEYVKQQSVTILPHSAAIIMN